MLIIQQSRVGFGKYVLSAFYRPFNYFSNQNNVALEYESMLKQAYLLPTKGHKVLIIQPRIKSIALQNRLKRSNCLVGLEPNLEEARSLIDSLPGWTTVGAVSFNFRSDGTNREQFFTKGVWEQATRIVKAYRNGDIMTDAECNDQPLERATAVLVNWPRLNIRQLVTMQNTWLLPVYDRYTLVVQIFVSRAHTQEARAQAQLAEIGLLRSRLPALFQSSNQVSGACERTFYSTPAGGPSMERLTSLLNEKESRILTLLGDIEKRRSKFRQQRREKRHKQLPVVSVVGYTNAGKTSLIKHLSGSQKLSSFSHVFATLDITHHRARLSSPSSLGIACNSTGAVQYDESSTNTSSCSPVKTGLPGLQLLFLDTIGFMADLPTNLVAAFRSTLAECLDTDLILHVIDISQPNWKSNAAHVEGVMVDAGIVVNNLTDQLITPSESNLPPSSGEVSSTILRVGNKLDLVDPDSILNFSELDVLVSAETGKGMDHLRELLQSVLLERLGWFTRTVEIDQGSSILSWLYSNAMVTNVQVSETDPQYLRVTAIFVPSVWDRLSLKLHVNNIIT